MPDSIAKDSEAEIQYPPSILEDVTKLVQRVQTFTGATGAAIALREGEDMVCRASRGSNAPDVGMMLSLDGTFTGLAVTGMKAVRCDDTENDPRVDAEISRVLRIKSMAVVPVLSGMRVSGVIATFSNNGNAFSDTHMAVLKTMADGLGATILRWMENQGISTNVPAPPRPQAQVAQPRVEAPRPPAPAPKFEAPLPPPPPRVEAPKVTPVPPPAPKVEAPAPKPFSFAAAAAAAAAAAPAPAVEKAPEKKEEPKKIEPKQQSKWTPAPAPKVEEELPTAAAIPVAKPEPKAEPKVEVAAKVEPKAPPKPEVAAKPEPKSEPKLEPAPMLSAPSFSYEAPSESKKSPVVIVGVLAVLLAAAAGGYYMFTHKASHPAPAATTASATTPSTTTGSTTQATPSSDSTLASTPTATTPTPVAATTASAQPAATANAVKPAAAKPLTQIADTTTPVYKPAPAPLVVAPSAATRTQTAEVAPPSISISGGTGPAIDVPVTTSAPKLSAPPPANAVIVPSRLLQRVNPIYPSSARQYRIEGAVTLSATIAPDGHVREAKVISGPPMLRDAAINAVKQWKYAPSTVNGRAVESSVQIVLQFKMPA